MFTQDSRKAVLTISALFSAALLYAGIIIALLTFAAWTEQNLHAFPFKEEDWLRYLIPSRFEAQGSDKIMLTGPSTVRENLRYERFEAAFPRHDIYQGGISLGTLEDVTAALEYMEKVYGTSALPEVLVLGISPRFVANIPDNRPFVLGLNRYSPYYSAKQDSFRIALHPKTVLEGALARVRFLTSKEPERFRTGFLAVANSLFWKSGYASDNETTLARGFNWLFATDPVGRLIDRFGYSKARQFTFSVIVRWMISPYKYSLNRPHRIPVVTRDKYTPDPRSWWRLVWDWDPRKDEKKTRARLKYFAKFVKQHGIRTVVVNMPERDANRVLFYEHNYRAYLDLVKLELDGMEFINFREFSDTSEFYDLEHTTPAGSVRLTDEIIRRTRASILR